MIIFKNEINLSPASSMLEIDEGFAPAIMRVFIELIIQAINSITLDIYK
jgi:hypothetical protein